MMKASLGPVMVIGEALFDVFPEEKRLGGAAFNYAFHLNGLGIRVHFISRVGDDAAGKDILDFARRFDFPIEGIQIDSEHATGEVMVKIDEKGNPDFDIVRDRAYDFIETNDYTDSLAKAGIRIMYLGTLIQRNPVSREAIKNILADLQSDSLVMSDLNLRAPFYNREIVEYTLQNCDILKINQDEMEEVRLLLHFQGSGAGLVTFLQEDYEIGSICITKGDKGSEFYETGNFESFASPVAKVKSLKDTVGAGDAFSAMLTAGLMAGWHKQNILKKASEFAAGICEIPGALPRNKEFYQPFKVQ